ncbi:cysteate synthase [Streptomyces sp. NPDC058534]|uniref:cysteate synthase n=1 Tax=Streptomyces sp. NPDC058534 TaxID=3346541 RepID=UPI0036505ABD
MAGNGRRGTGGEVAAGDRHYVLVCSLCGDRRPDDGLILDCPRDHPPALLRTEYANRRFTPDEEYDGLFRYREWLPVVRAPRSTGRGVVYRSRGLAGALGLRRLWIAFNGYWPERGASLETGTFKEFEALTVLGRLPGREHVLTVASSGNTAAAFAWVCSRQRVPCLIVVSGKGLGRLRFPEILDPCVTLVVIDDGDYPDAIALASSISRLPPFRAEGGVKNVGRRDGLAAVLLTAYEEMRCLPSHYFQAVGSGTGAIAVLEAARRISVAAGGLPLPRLMLCQNLPFTPIHDAWRMGATVGKRELTDGFRESIAKVHADELTNWAPPYSIRAGVHDALRDSDGDVLVADNASVVVARTMFRELEGIDIEPAAGVAVACLRDAVAQDKVDRDAVVLLNITGGGRRRLATDRPLVGARPHWRLTKDALTEDGLAQRIAARRT